MGAAEPVRSSPRIRPAAWPPERRQPLVGPLGRAEEHPTAVKLIVGNKLRRLREQAKLLPRDVERALGISKFRTSRVETGQAACREAEALSLLDLYRARDPEHVDEFMALVRLCHRPEWWKTWSDVAADFFQPLLALEGAAERIRTYEHFYVPGLLQTPDYARAVIRLEHPDLLPSEVDRRAELRNARKQHLWEPDGPVLWALIDESVLLRDFGDPAALRAQIEYLVSCADHPGIVLQIARMAATQQVPLGNNVTHLKFARSDLASSVYIEHLIGSVFSQDPQHVKKYQMQLDRLAACALTPEQSLEEMKNLL